MIFKIFKKKDYTEKQVTKGVKFLKSCHVIINKYFTAEYLNRSIHHFRVSSLERDPVQKFNLYCVGIYKYELEKISKKSNNFESFTSDVFKKLAKDKGISNPGAWKYAFDGNKLIKDAQFYFSDEFYKGYKDAENFKGETSKLIEKSCKYLQNLNFDENV